MPTRPVFRFAPSPNGDLHLGHAYSALLNFHMARKGGGRFLVRIEDIDIGRCRPEFEAGILEDLAWLGLSWEEPVHRQSEYFDGYRSALGKLSGMGLTFLSRATRKEIAEGVAAREAALGETWPRDPDGAPLYPFGVEDRAAGNEVTDEPAAVRLRMEEAVARAGDLVWSETGAGPNGETGSVAARPLDWGDVLVARKDVPTSYHLSVVVDDALQGVTHIVRGQDLFWSTSVHRLLQTLLGFPAPAYHHHRLILGEDGRKLSKSARDTSLRSLRDAGATPGDIRRMIGFVD
ncbi:MAG: tRNA glutamyl-Q(34) synthetase GluQRS [Hyphomicrobiales bacterium]|nr:MAG: tRNA glutamyl-Q(34) synthetase GluQRS [Hyphomicrobiales bacterium]